MQEFTFVAQVPIGSAIIMLVLIVAYGIKSFLG